VGITDNFQSTHVENSKKGMVFNWYSNEQWMSARRITAMGEAKVTWTIFL
jgi:hypothetical protein